MLGLCGQDLVVGRLLGQFCAKLLEASPAEQMPASSRMDLPLGKAKPSGMMVMPLW